MQTVYRYEFAYIKSNMYMILEGENALIIDPNTSLEALQILDEANIKNATILLTHEHFDHTAGVNLLKQRLRSVLICQRQCAESIAIAKNNRPLIFLTMKRGGDLETLKAFYKTFPLYECKAEKIFETKYEFEWESHKISLMATPGHSKGSSCIDVDSRYLFTGDSLIPDIPVITRFPGGSAEEYNDKTLPYLKNINPDTYIMPGHGIPCRMNELQYENGCFRKVNGIDVGI